MKSFNIIFNQQVSRRKRQEIIDFPYVDAKFAEFSDNDVAQQTQRNFGLNATRSHSPLLFS